MLFLPSATGAAYRLIERGLKFGLLDLSRMASTESVNSVTHLTQEEAANLDKELFDKYAFSVVQLMELAGLSVASAIASKYDVNTHDKPVICCGPGNNGGDGLVCARHLRLFGYKPVVVCPKLGRGQLFENLLTQCKKFDIPVIDRVPSQPLRDIGNLVVDSVFGFSFKPPNRNPDFAKLLRLMDEHSGNNVEIPLVSIDIPSGWDVNSGDENLEKDQAEIDAELKIPALQPECLISLTAPKLSAKRHKGLYHFLGGRFVPDSIKQKYNLSLPEYKGQNCFLEL